MDLSKGSKGTGKRSAIEKKGQTLLSGLFSVYLP
jgi:hypothetical protein